MSGRKKRLAVEPLSPQRWRDLEQLFGARGACGGCWCMWWRLARSEFDRQKGSGNKRAFRALVDAGEITGLLGCADGEPVAWCAVAPREHYPVLARSRVLKPVDDQPVWSVTCLFVRKGERRRGRSVEMLRAAAAFARGHGARLIEGYPQEPRRGAIPDAFAFTGTQSAFQQAGFREVARRSPTRPIMRRRLSPRRASR